MNPLITQSDYLFHYSGPFSESLAPLTLPEVFDHSVRLKDSQPAILGDFGTLSWLEWQRASKSLAQFLKTLGIGKGDVVGVYLPNSWEFLVSHVAIAYLGAVFLPLHMAHAHREVQALLTRTEARALIVARSAGHRDQVPLAKSLAQSVPSLRSVLWVGQPPPGSLSFHDACQPRPDDAPLPASVEPDDPFLLAASSGTASVRPKICLHSHAGFLSNALRTALDGESRPDDIILSGSPFSHAFGLLSVHLSILMASAEVVLPSWNADRCVQLASRWGVSVLFAVPAQVIDLVRTVRDNPAKPPLCSLREVRTGGSVVPAELITGIRTHLGASTVVQWGMSEVGAGTYTRATDPPELASRTIGRPVTGAEIAIVDNGEIVGPHHVGELCYRSPYMFRGYYRDDALTAEAISPEGWLHTGDLAELNADGTVTYRGRKTEIINRGGLKFSALEVESLLSDLDGVDRLAVVARPDSRLGERAVLVVSLRPGETLSLPEVKRHLEIKGLAKYKWPEELVILDHLPTTPTGKVARTRLKNTIWGKTSQEDTGGNTNDQ